VSNKEALERIGAPSGQKFESEPVVAWAGGYPALYETDGGSEIVRSSEVGLVFGLRSLFPELVRIKGKSTFLLDFRQARGLRPSIETRVFNVSANTKEVNRL
jgi:hypothetical protein